MWYRNFIAIYRVEEVLATVIISNPMTDNLVPVEAVILPLFIRDGPFFVMIHLIMIAP